MTDNFDAEAFRIHLDSEQEARGLSWRTVALESGVSPSQLCQIHRNEARPSIGTFAKLCAWGRFNANDFIQGSASSQGRPPTLPKISLLLQLDPLLHREDAEFIYQLVKISYKHLGKGRTK